jgi:hypothetical protein
MNNIGVDQFYLDHIAGDRSGFADTTPAEVKDIKAAFRELFHYGYRAAGSSIPALRERVKACVALYPKYAHLTEDLAGYIEVYHAAHAKQIEACVALGIEPTDVWPAV